MSLSDFYQWPHTIKFDSWEHLERILAGKVPDIDFDKVSAAMRGAHTAMLQSTAGKWRELMAATGGGDGGVDD